MNLGYEMNKNLQLKSLNNIPVKNLKHLKKLIDEIEINNEGKTIIVNVNETPTIKKSEKTSKSNLKSKTIKKTTKKTEIAAETMNDFKAMVFEFSNDQLIVLDATEAMDARLQVNYKSSV